MAAAQKVADIAQTYEASVKLSTLKEWPGNPKTHDVDAIVESMRANGSYGAVLAQRSTRRLLAGHGRKKAHKKLGHKTVGVFWLDVDDATAARIVAADNRSQERGGWNDEELLVFLRKLQDDDNLVGSGFDDDAISTLAASLEDDDATRAEGDDDSTSETPMLVATRVSIDALLAIAQNKLPPVEQVAHIKASLAAYGFYRNVVLSRDSIILVGRGLVAAAQALNFAHVPCVRLALDASDPRATALLVSDNEDVDASLEAAYYGTRDASDRADDPASAWVGMPEYANKNELAWKRVIVNLANADDLARFAALVEQQVLTTTRSIWYPRQAIAHVADKAYETADAAT